MAYTKFNDSQFLNALEVRSDLEVFKENKVAIYALELFYGLDDVLNTLAPAVTGGSDDAKTDILFVSRELNSITLIQAYSSISFKVSAKGNKGADLSYAAGVLLATEKNDIPNGIKPQVLDARDALESGEVTMLHIWYVHNCPENGNIQKQMQLLHSPIKQMLEQYEITSGTKINIDIKEVGLESLDKFYSSSTQSIIIDDNIYFEPTRNGFYKNQDDWETFITTVKGSWLAALYKQYTTNDLFSSNVRSFMGANKKDNDKIINAGIQSSAQTSSKDFFVYNNGITALVHDFELEGENNTSIKSIRGISIVNGAQTTGSLGTLPEGTDISDLEVGIRFIKCENKSKIESITRFNNSQNRVLQSDFRAHDVIQKRLRAEFTAEIAGDYDGGLRGVSNLDRKLKIDAHSAAQALMAWHGSPYDSYHNKTKIWENDKLYHAAFDSSISSKHVIFIFSLLEAINLTQEELKNKDKQNDTQTSERELLLLLNERGSAFIIIHALHRIFEIILEEKIKSPYQIGFNSSCSRQECIQLWRELINQLSYNIMMLKGGLVNRLSKQSDIETATESFAVAFGQTFLAIKSQLSKNPYSKFIKKITNKIQ